MYREKTWKKSKENVIVCHFEEFGFDFGGLNVDDLPPLLLLQNQERKAY